MEYKGLDLHGIHELVDVRGRLIMSRYPNDINKEINHDVAYQMIGGEIRLAIEGDCCITIGSLFCWTQAKCLVFYGDYASPEEIVFNKEVSISLTPQKVFRNQSVDIPKELCNPHMFQNNVVRIVLLGEGIYIKNVFGKYRLPKPSEVPQKKMLVYGTSISQGCNATSPEMSYAWQLSRKLKCDLYNYALSGHAFCEPSVCDYINESNDYDITIFELSVNMLAEGYSLEIFEKRVHYLLENFIKKHPSTEIYCIGILPYYGDYNMKKESETLLATPNEYRKVFEAVVQSFVETNIYYVDPFSLLSFYNLSSDFIHPSNLGMIEIANNLYEFIKKPK